MRKQRSDKGKKRKPYNQSEQEQEQEQTATENKTPDNTKKSVDDLFNTDEVFKEFTDYEAPEKTQEKTSETTPKNAKDDFIEDDWLEEGDEAEGEGEPIETETRQKKDWIKFAIRTIKKVDTIRALGFSFYSGESTKKYLEYQNINSNDDLVQDVAEVMEKYYVEMKPEYAIATTVIMGTFLMYLDAKEDKLRNKKV
jgi:hypothetical protein